MITNNLSTLKIHKLTKEQYERALAAGNIDENALYLTPDEGVDLTGYVTYEALQDLLNIDYDMLAFDTTEIVFDNSSSTSPILGQAILGQLILA